MKQEEKGTQSEIFSLTVPSHPKFLYVIRSAVYPVLIDAGFSRKETRQLILALDEACSNIIKYAYQGDPGKVIFLTVTLSSGELRFELRDTGKKPDLSRIAPRELEDVRPGGLGTHFMKSVFETVDYDTSAQEGTVLTLVRKRPTAGARGVSA